MANERTNFGESTIFDYFYRPATAAPTRPTSMKVALLTAITDAEAGTVTETTYTGYVQQDAGFGALDAAGVGVNAAQINFPALGSGPVTIVGHALVDHLGRFWDVVWLERSM